jgi:hypothetical protein
LTNPFNWRIIYSMILNSIYLNQNKLWRKK